MALKCTPAMTSHLIKTKHSIALREKVYCKSIKSGSWYFACVTLHPEVHIKWFGCVLQCIVHITGIEFNFSMMKNIVSQAWASKEDEELLTAHTLLISAPLLINNMAISRLPCPQALANGVSSIESDAKFRLTVCRRECNSMVIMC